MLISVFCQRCVLLPLVVHIGLKHKMDKNICDKVYPHLMAALWDEVNTVSIFTYKYTR